MSEFWNPVWDHTGSAELSSGGGTDDNPLSQMKSSALRTEIVKARALQKLGSRSNQIFSMAKQQKKQTVARLNQLFARRT